MLFPKITITEAIVKNLDTLQLEVTFFFGRDLEVTLESQ